MFDNDFDDLLNLEEKFYREGFEEGVQAGKQNNFREGKELGIQTGYQTFLYVGQIRGLTHSWKLYVDKINSGEISPPSERVGGKERDWVKVSNQISELKSLVDSLYENGKLNLTNSDDDVSKISSTIKALRTKARIIAGILAQRELFLEMERTALQVAGKIQTNQTLAPEEDMW
ncbi:unnamed protein product [Kuraishia capsulata CBS 1993]|uniref:Essential protein Yae1 N-terminal domain-containing protein n=1 Tax=Kuraishia capsulata CBS 1993 TaxID=1382522 RepID=W6MJX5_9ASCO|nr:uncharacterized protein KUCA_T00002818001 [Kuraishia capsulata CBS 1993]CDK26844.1 unnamed protein product [Kuraishia capsulata CBS 1993]